MSVYMHTAQIQFFYPVFDRMGIQSVDRVRFRGELKRS